MTRKLTLVSPVGRALPWMVNDPAAGMTCTPFMVLSLEPTVARITELVETKELVTTSEAALAAKFTLPAFLLIVRAPVVPTGVMVVSNMDARKSATVMAFGVFDSALDTMSLSVRATVDVVWMILRSSSCMIVNGGKRRAQVLPYARLV